MGVVARWISGTVISAVTHDSVEGIEKEAISDIVDVVHDAGDVENLIVGQTFTTHSIDIKIGGKVFGLSLMLDRKS